MNKKVIDLLKKRLMKYGIKLSDEKIVELGVFGVIELIIRHKG